LKHADYCLGGFFLMLSERVARGSDAIHDQVVWIFLNCIVCPYRGLIMSTQKEVGVRRRTLRTVTKLIEGAKSHRTGQIFNRGFWLTAQHPRPSGEVPRRRQVWIEYECTIYRGRSSVQVTGNIRDHVPGSGERSSIISLARRLSWLVVLLHQFPSGDRSSSRLPFAKRNTRQPCRRPMRNWDLARSLCRSSLSRVH
jgi:hypothetical protein